ncbi:hypothetical protein H8I69_06015 [Serratia fonticola]|uniref:hypothetical protein n=1 Tax=Serratia fonticola TaxID=47917 RepID=UPI0015C64018|nr:hypothetical protein [Serratia fonticola]MBC3378673.1 hypothetical protein [Serratia fonticola]NYA37873.1 hypothetical protein [Serratia fonticola]
MNKLLLWLLAGCITTTEVQAVCGVRITQGFPAYTQKIYVKWKIPPDVDLSAPGTVYVLNPGGRGEPLIRSISSTGYASYYHPGWLRVFTNDGPFTIAVKQASWDSVNGFGNESERLKPVIKSPPWIALGENSPEIRVPMDQSFSGKEIAHGLIVNTTMTAGSYLKIDDGMCHPSVPVGTVYTFIVEFLAGPLNIEIRDAGDNILWRPSSGSEGEYRPLLLGQIYYTEVADVTVDISPASLDFGRVLFDEIKSLPVSITTQSNAVNTKINLTYEFIDDAGEAVHNIDALGSDGLSDVITSSAIKNSPVVITRNVSVRNKSNVAGVWNGFLKVTATIP